MFRPAMAVDLSCLPHIAFYLVTMQIISCNSRTSTHWKLSDGKVQASPLVGMGHLGQGGPQLYDTPMDSMFSILTNPDKKTINGESWTLEGELEDTCNGDCNVSKLEKEDDIHDIVIEDGFKQSNETKNAESNNTNNTTTESSTASAEAPPAKKEKKKPLLDCGKPVNTTQFDHLSGIANRKNHPNIPEPEVAMIFKKTYSKNNEVDMNEVERRLRKLKKEKPKSWQVYNQIGNFWRIKGHTQLSIECFRKALSFDAGNSDVLLNLARVLYNLQYLDDAIFLTRRSLEMQSPDKNTWLQHFTLGEILKAYGHYQEAALHFRHTLDLNPGFQPAQAHLQEMEASPDGTVTYYTLFIILFLVLGVLCGILTSIDGNLDELSETMKTQRHFNRAMAMRSIKLGINPKLIRMRKQYNTGC